MSFRPAGSRLAAFGGAFAFALVLATGAASAQDAKHGPTRAPAHAASAPQQAPTTAPVTGSTAQPANNGLQAAATPSAAASAAQPAAPTNLEAQAKPGDATAGQGKAAACGACHGMDGNSTDPQYPKLAGQHEAYIVRQLTLFKSGKRQNPIMMGMAAGLSEQDMHDVGAYFSSKRSLPGVADAALVELGQKLFREGDAQRGIPACMACHGPDGRGNPGAIYPQLASQHAQYVEAKLKAWHDGQTWGDDAHAQIMPAIAKQLNDKDIAALASYIEGLHPATGAPAQPASP